MTDLDIGRELEVAPPDLPIVAFSKSGKSFDPRLDHWQWDDGVFRLSFDFLKLPTNFHQFRDRLKRCLVVFLKGHSPVYARNIFNVFLDFARATPSLAPNGASITPLEIGNYGATLGEARVSRLGHLKPLLKKWFMLGLQGVDEATMDYIEGRRVKGNDKGRAVRTRDPVKGPFTDSEFQALFRALNVALEDQSVPTWAAAMAKLLAACGGRPSQYASLKVLDYTPAVAGARPSPARLALPQVKNGTEHSRMAFLEFDLSAQTSMLLERHLGDLRSRGLGPNAPMFPMIVIRTDGEGDATRDRDDLFYGHPTPIALTSALKRDLGVIAPISERTGFEPISLSPRRFRYTFGTRLAEEGASKALIADRLGHADLQSVDVYFEASPILVDNVDRAMGASLAPIAEAFMGTVIEGESQATQKGVRGKRIIDFRISIKPLGSCGKSSACTLERPVACYTCHRFQPWIDGPHEEELQRLLDERSECEDPRIAGVNDDAITAVREVIAECEQARRDRKAETPR